MVDSLVSGYNFVDDNTNTDDKSGHGTHVAGIAAAVSDNGTGIAGVAGGSKIMPVKVLDNGGYGTTEDIVNGILFAVNNGADVINMSLGSWWYSRALDEAVQYAVSKGVTVVAATGNRYSSMVDFPAALEGVIGVGAVQWNGLTSNYEIAPFSNTGSGVDVVAPGVDIMSTVPIELDSVESHMSYNLGDSQGDGYTLLSGTSMASPFVAGLAALVIASSDVAMDCSAVQAAIQSNVIDLGQVGSDNTYGYGVVSFQETLVSNIELPKLTLGFKGTENNNEVFTLDAESFGKSVTDQVYGEFGLFMGKFITDDMGGFLEWETAPQEVSVIEMVYSQGQAAVPLDGTGNYLLYAAGNDRYIGSNVYWLSISDSLSNSLIEGTISLPEGKVAGSGGMSLYVEAYDSQGNWADTNLVSIAPSESSANFSVIVPAGAGYKVGYYLLNDDEQYVIQGYYNESGTVLDMGAATAIDTTSGNVSNINLTIKETASVIDDVSYTFDGAQEIGLGNRVDYTLDYVGDVDCFKFVVQEQDNFAIEGSYNGDIEITLYSDSSIYSYCRWGKDSFENKYNLVPGTYYLKIRDIGGSKGNYYFSLYNMPTISGTISLPSGTIAPQGGIDVNINAYDSSTYKYVSTYVNIPEGESSIQYTMPSYMGNYILAYKIFSSTSDVSAYAGGGYYSDNGTSATYSNATKVSVTVPNQSITANLSILKIADLADDFANTTEGAAALNIGEEKAGKLDYDGDEDYFKFTVDQSGDYLISVDTHPEVLLYNNDQWIHYKGFYADTSKYLTPGTYYIKVADSYGYTGDYNVSVRKLTSAAPSATNVSITGTKTVGNTLTGSYSYNDVDGDIESGSTYRWLRASSETGEYTAIAGAVTNQYTLTSSDAGMYIKFEVTPGNAAVPTTGTPASAVIGPISSAAVSQPVYYSPIISTPEEPSEPEKITISEDEDGNTNALVEVNAEALEEKLKSDDTESIVINAQVEGKIDNLTVDVPVEIISGAEGKGKSIVIKSDAVSFEIEPGAISAKEGEKSIKLKATQISADEANEQLESRPQGASAVSSMLDFNLEIDNNKITSFEKPITVTIKYDKDKIKDEQKLGVYYYNETDKKWEYVGGKVNKDGTISCSLNHFSKYAVMEYNKTFKDIAKNFAKSDIELLASKHIITGLDSDTFLPDNAITRADFIQWLANALGIKGDTTKSKFNDVPEDAPYKDALNALYNAKIIYGAPNMKFLPDGKIDRETMAIILIRAYSYMTGIKTENMSTTQQIKFKDQKFISSNARQFVDISNALGLIKGYNGIFNPKNKLTRAQAVVVLKRLIDKVESK